MNWVLIGFLLGSQVTSQHETREACEGRAVLLREKGAVSVRCIEVQSFIAPHREGLCVNNLGDFIDCGGSITLPK